ncbi:MAG: hypothetical protein EAY75_13530 [Bacteroidetes bacterium]|nr:MAG: hypothetical protein EAY75_13530 [Bacteroidota bacterium]
MKKCAYIPVGFKGFASFYGHMLADRKYGVLADAILDQKRDEIASSATESAHRRYLEAWKPDVSEDAMLSMKTGLFYDLWDSNQDIVVDQRDPDNVSGLTLENQFKAYKGDFLYGSANQWWHMRDNIQVPYPSQTTAITYLFQTYGVQ